MPLTPPRRRRRRQKVRTIEGGSSSCLLFYKLGGLLNTIIAWLPDSDFVSVERVCSEFYDMFNEELRYLRTRRFDLGSAQEGIVVLLLSAGRPVYEVYGGNFGWRRRRMLEKTQEQRDAGFVAIHHEIFIVGGVVDHKLSNIVKCYDARDDEWFNLPPLQTARKGCRCTFLQGHLVVVGGWDQAHNWLNSVEIFDAKNQIWHFLPSLPEECACSYELGAEIRTTTIVNKLFIFVSPSAFNAVRRSLWSLDCSECLAHLEKRNQLQEHTEHSEWCRYQTPSYVVGHGVHYSQGSCEFSAFNDQIYIIFCARAWIFDPESEVWSSAIAPSLFMSSINLFGGSLITAANEKNDTSCTCLYHIARCPNLFDMRHPISPSQQTTKEDVMHLLYARFDGKYWTNYKHFFDIPSGNGILPYPLFLRLF